MRTAQDIVDGLINETKAPAYAWAGEKSHGPVKTDDMGRPIGPEGQRRFATSKPDQDGPMKGSTSAVLLGRRGHAAWAKAEKGRGNTVPAWEQGKPYKTEGSSLTATQIVSRLIEAD